MSSIFSNNLRTIISQINNQVSPARFDKTALAKAIEVGPSTVTGWLNNTRNATSHNLKRIARYVSHALGIPYDLLHDGNVLVTDDLEQIIKNLSQARKKETSATNLQYKENINPADYDPPSQDEIEFLLQLRKGARTKYPLSRATLDRIQETVALLGGPDSSQHLQAIEFLRFFSRGWENAPQRAKESRGPGSSDRKQ